MLIQVLGNIFNLNANIYIYFLIQTEQSTTVTHSIAVQRQWKSLVSAPKTNNLFKRFRKIYLGMKTMGQPN